MELILGSLLDWTSSDRRVQAQSEHFGDPLTALEPGLPSPNPMKLQLTLWHNLSFHRTRAKNRAVRWIRTLECMC